MFSDYPFSSPLGWEASRAVARHGGLKQLCIDYRTHYLRSIQSRDFNFQNLKSKNVRCLIVSSLPLQKCFRPTTDPLTTMLQRGLPHSSISQAHLHAHRASTPHQLLSSTFNSMSCCQTAMYFSCGPSVKMQMTGCFKTLRRRKNYCSKLMYSQRRHID